MHIWSKYTLPITETIFRWPHLPFLLNKGVVGIYLHTHGSAIIFRQNKGCCHVTAPVLMERNPFGTNFALCTCNMSSYKIVTLLGILALLQKKKCNVQKRCQTFVLRTLEPFRILFKRYLVIVHPLEFSEKVIENTWATSDLVGGRRLCCLSIWASHDDSDEVVLEERLT